MSGKWLTYVNENLFFAKLQLQWKDTSSTVAERECAGRAALRFLQQAYVGFLNELAEQRRIKVKIESLADLEGQLEVESPEVISMKLAAAQPDSWLAQLLKQYGEISRPRKNETPQDENIIAATSTVSAMEAAAILEFMQAFINEVREHSFEW
ncbi:hypothetical protein HCH_02066 [Hahella chejuensis KCTC 2396]|uniref:Uncharacterized protein n=1 Tax=Hahella chejuensis (strain KCTC 2396) TaxID=349521 RepID=Q2SKC7_HAHCH|nr:DUF6586 family protein [Hahella chejuensis]ABC28897.1 hypothetical protein HCH_02066 [Hahella chejuensis KCTC 2396]